MASTAYLGVVEVLHIENQVAGGIGPMRKERHRASHMHEPGARRLQPLLVTLIVIALKFVGYHHQRNHQQAGQKTQLRQRPPHKRMPGVAHKHLP